MTTKHLDIPDDLESVHEVIRATATAYRAEDETWYDGRIWRFSGTPGLFYLRVAPKHLEFSLRALQGVIEASERQGLEIGEVQGSRLHRAGVGIGSHGNLAAVEVVELRDLAFAGKKEVNQWRWINDQLLPGEEPPAIRPKIPRGNGKVRVVLPRRHDWPGSVGPNWRRTFTGPVGEPFQKVLVDVVAALEARARAGG